MNPIVPVFPKNFSVKLALTQLVWWFGIMFATQAHSGWQPPLSDSELSNATDLIDALQIEQRQRSADHNQHPLGKQTLLIELQEQKNSTNKSERLAEIFTFDYHYQTSELHLVDVTSNYILSSRDLKTQHLPLSEAEIVYSESLMWANPDVKRLVDEETARLQQLNTHTTTSSAIQSRVAIWVPDTSSQAGTSGCDVQRCALLSLFTNTEQSLAVEPVVNLITGTVYTTLFP